MAINATNTRVADTPVQNPGVAPTVGGSGPDRDPSPRRLRLLVILSVLALVAVLGGAFLSTSLTRSPAGTAPAGPSAPAEINPTGENPNQREGRVPIPLPATNGENPNQREGRVLGQH